MNNSVMTDAIEVPGLTLEQKVSDAHQRARSREWAPVGFLDNVFRDLKHELGRLQAGDGYGRPAPSAAADRVKALDAALAEFTRWADMPAAEMPGAVDRIMRSPNAPTPPDVLARDHIVAMRRRGVVLTADLAGNLSAYPVSKLTEMDKQTLGSLKPYFVTELNREVYIVP